ARRVEPRDDGVEFEADVRPHPRLTRPPSDPAPAKQAPEATRIPPLNRAWSPSKAARPFTSPNRPRQPTSKPESDRLLAPLAIRVALLAGLWRTQNSPDLYDRMESACSGRESIRFDAAKIKLLADAHPAFSHLQQIRDSSPFWSRYFLQRKRKTAPVSRFRAT